MRGKEEEDAYTQAEAFQSGHGRLFGDGREEHRLPDARSGKSQAHAGCCVLSSRMFWTVSTMENMEKGLVR